MFCLQMAKKWTSAGAAFCKAADIRMQLQNKHESASNLIDAAGCFKKADPQQAVSCYNRVCTTNKLELFKINYKMLWQIFFVTKEFVL